VGECELEHRFLVLQSLGSPEIAGVCEEVERSSKCLVEAAQRTAAVGDLLADLDLPFFEAADSVLVYRDDREWLRLRDAFEESRRTALRACPRISSDLRQPDPCGQYRTLRRVPRARRPRVDARLPRVGSRWSFTAS